MGMYHYAYSPKHKLCLYVWKTGFTPLNGVKLNSYYQGYVGNPWGNKDRMVRSGVILQSWLRGAGKVVRGKPVRYKRLGESKDRFFFGHTYLDPSCVGILEKYREVDGYVAPLLLDLIKAYPCRWILFGDDMCEPLRMTRGTKRGSLRLKGQYTLDQDRGW